MLCRTYPADYTPAVPSITSRLGEEIRRLRDQGHTVPAIARELGVSEASVWRSLRRR
jgi:IS30 family transposase